MNRNAATLAILLVAASGDRLATADAYKRECSMNDTCENAMEGAKTVCGAKGGITIGVMGPCVQWPDGRQQQCVTCHIKDKPSAECAPERLEAETRLAAITKDINEDQTTLTARGLNLIRLDPGVPLSNDVPPKLARLLVDKAIVLTAGDRGRGKSKDADAGGPRDIEKLKTRLDATPLVEWPQDSKIVDALAKLLARAARQADPAPIASALADAFGPDLSPEKLRAVAAVTGKALPRGAQDHAGWGVLALEAVLQAWDTGLELPAMEIWLGWSAADLAEVKTRAQRLKDQLIALGPARAALARYPPCQ